jgi:plastocyanin
MHIHPLAGFASRPTFSLFAVLILFAIPLIPTAAPAVTTNVDVGDNFFRPASVTIKASDTVQWNWIGSRAHTSTSNSGLWSSGTLGNGSDFSHTFDNAGSFPYRCTIHAGQSGTVTVQAVANQPPTVSIVSPASGAKFAAPWTGTIQANTGDSDGSVSKVSFYLGETLLSTVNNPGPNAIGGVTNLPAGSYSLKAVATDNLSVSNTSAVVSVSVLDPAPINLSNAERISPTAFQFSYSGTPGLSYVIRRTEDFVQWSPLATNTAVGDTSSFLDNDAVGLLNLYSVSLLPNP